MSLTDRLADLDARLLPPAAARFGRWRQALRRRRELLRSRLPSLDGEDLLRRLRARPGPAVAALLLAVLAGAGATLAAGAAGGGGGTAPLASGYAGFDRVGPAVGEQVDGYLAGARNRLRTLVRDHPASTVYAVVDFTGYESPASLDAVLAGTPQVVRAYLHVVVAHETTSVEVVSLGSLADLPARLHSVAVDVGAQVNGFTRLLALLPAHGPHAQPALRNLYQQRLEVARAERAQLTAGCRCVYSVVVHASARALGRLAGRPGVRVVDPAPRGAQLDLLAVVPVLPETTGRMPAVSG